LTVINLVWAVKHLGARRESRAKLLEQIAGLRHNVETALSNYAV